VRISLSPANKFAGRAAARGLTFCLLLSALCLPVFAQEVDVSAGGITVETAVERALASSAALQKEAIDLRLDRVAAKNLWAQVFPSINASGGVSYAIPLKSDLVRSDPSYTGSLRVSLSLGANLPSTMKKLSLAYQGGLLNYDAVRRQTALAAEKDFYTLLASARNLAVLEDSMRLALNQNERDQTARRNGYMGELDFMSSSLSAETARLNYNRGQAAHETLLRNFYFDLGIDEKDPPALQGSIEVEECPVDSEKLIAERLASRPDLAALRIFVEQAKNAWTESFLSAKAPSVSFALSAGAQYPDGINDTMSASVTLNIPLDPWIPRSVSDQQVSRVRAEYEKACLDLGDLERSARTDIESRVLNLQTMWKEVQIARLQVQYSARSYELSEQGYTRGTVNFLDFETARNKSTAARQQLLESLLAYKLQILDLCAVLDMDEAALRLLMTGEER
jgi:outer membrane protein TolC